MSDLNSLNGSSVRDGSGRTGRIVSVTESAVNLAWMQRGLIAEEVALARNALPAAVQVLTLKEGWKPLGTVAGLTESKAPTKLSALAEDIASLDEAPDHVGKDGKPRYVHKHQKGDVDTADSAHHEGERRNAFSQKDKSPFKNPPPTNGPATGGKSTRRVKKQLDWDCSYSGPYEQDCVKLVKRHGKIQKSGEHKHIKIKKDYKKKYNHAYKIWHARQGHGTK